MRKQIWKKNFKIFNFLAQTHKVPFVVIPDSEWTDCDGDVLMVVDMDTSINVKNEFINNLLGEYESLRQKFTTTNYYTIEFLYPGPRVRILGDNDEGTNVACQALINACKIVENILKQKFEFIHAYSWPDGSLYYTVKTELPKEDLQIILEDLFKNTDICVSTVYIEPDEDTWNVMDKTTVKSTFDNRKLRELERNSK